MIKRWITSECPDTKVQIRLSETVTETITDEEGYFDVEIENASGEKSLEITLPSDPEQRTFSVPIHHNDTNPSIIVISDVDDTIFISNTARLLGMVKTALTGNALTRQVFPGIAELYGELRTGQDGSSRNPISYVTSSPWNLHSLISMIFDLRGIPHGAYFMTDWGLSETDWLKESNPIHKRRAILRIMGWFPESRVVLFGDSSQHDAEIYTRIAIEQPERIAAIAIRNVTGLSEPEIDIPDTVPFLLHDDTPEARDFVFKQLGWISK
ncbi:MAG: phosphatase domain-containing protein [Luteolibacter sp.]